jgi:hypothetical protein
MASCASCSSRSVSTSASLLGSWRRNSSPRPALSSHCGRRLRTLLVGTRDPRRQRWVALTMAVLVRAPTNPQILEQGFSCFLASRSDSFFSKIVAFLPRRPLVDTPRGEKCGHCSRRVTRCFFFFSRSWAANALCRSLDRFDLALTLVAPTSRAHSAPRAQSQQIEVSPRSSLRLLQERSFTEVSLFSSSDFSTKLQLVWILGLSQTADGEQALEVGQSKRLTSFPCMDDERARTQHLRTALGIRARVTNLTTDIVSWPFGVCQTESHTLESF